MAGWDGAVAPRREGRRELERKTSSLAWSGLAAGMSMGFSFIAQGLLKHHLPNAAWEPLITKFGYSIGAGNMAVSRESRSARMAASTPGYCTLTAAATPSRLRRMTGERTFCSCSSGEMSVSSSRAAA